MGLFGKPRIEDDERVRCLAHEEAVIRVSAFWDRESDLFNSTLVKYLNSVTENPLAAREVCRAANRLVQAAQEVICRHEAIQPVPGAALRMRGTYSSYFLCIKDWAESTLAAMEALANGMTPCYEYVQQLVGKYESAWCTAQEEDKKFLERLGLTADEIEASLRTIHRDYDAAKTDSWQPEPCTNDFSEAGEIPQQV